MTNPLPVIVQLRHGIQQELDWWTEELANCTGTDACDRALKHINTLSRLLDLRVERDD